MTEHDIVSIVRSAGFSVADQFCNTCDEQAAIRLFGVAAAFGAAMEREACAMIGDGYHDDEANCGDLIRARGANA